MLWHDFSRGLPLEIVNLYANNLQFQRRKQDISLDLDTLIKNMIYEIFPNGKTKNIHEELILSKFTKSSTNWFYRRLVIELQHYYNLSPFKTLHLLKQAIQSLKDQFNFQAALNIPSYYKLLNNSEDEAAKKKYLEVIRFETVIFNSYSPFVENNTIENIIKRILNNKFENVMSTIPKFNTLYDFTEFYDYINDFSTIEHVNKFDMTSEILKALQYNEEDINSYFQVSQADFIRDINSYINNEFAKQDNKFIKTMQKFLVYKANKEINELYNNQYNDDTYSSISEDLTLLNYKSEWYVNSTLYGYSRIITNYGLDKTKIDYSKMHYSLNKKDNLHNNKGTLYLGITYNYNLDTQWILFDNSIKTKIPISTIDKAINILKHALSTLKFSIDEIHEFHFHIFKIIDRFPNGEFYNFLYNNQELEISLEEFNALFEQTFELPDFKSLLETQDNFQEIIKIKFDQNGDNKIKYKFGIKYSTNETKYIPWKQENIVIKSYFDSYFSYWQTLQWKKDINWLDEFLVLVNNQYTTVYKNLNKIIEKRTNFNEIEQKLIKEYRLFFLYLDEFSVKKILTTAGLSTIFTIELTQDLKNRYPHVDIRTPKKTISIILSAEEMTVAKRVSTSQIKRNSDIQKVINEILKPLKPSASQTLPKIYTQIDPKNYYVIHQEELVSLENVINEIQSELNVDVSLSLWKSLPRIPLPDGSLPLGIKEGIEFTLSVKLTNLSNDTSFIVEQKYFVVLAVTYNTASEKDKQEAINEIKKVLDAAVINPKIKKKILNEFINAIADEKLTKEELDLIKNETLLKIRNLIEKSVVLKQLREIYKGKTPKRIIKLLKDEQMFKIIEEIVTNKNFSNELKKQMLNSKNLIELLKKFSEKNRKDITKALDSAKDNSKYTYFGIGIGLGSAGLMGVAGSGAMIMSNRRINNLKGNYNVKSKKGIIFAILLTTTITITSSIGSLLIFFIQKGGI